MSTLPQSVDASLDASLVQPVTTPGTALNKATLNDDGTLASQSTVIVTGNLDAGNTTITQSGSTTTVDSGNSVVVITTDQDVYVNITDENYEQNFITNEASTAGGDNGQIQFNENGAFVGDDELVFNTTNKVLSAGGISTDNLLYANGDPWNFSNVQSLPGGANGEIQFNDDGEFNGVPGVTWANARFNLGVLSNLSIAGGTSGQVLTTDGAGNLSWGSASGTYGNSNVAAYLPTYTGNVGAGNVNVTGTVYSNGLSATGLSSLTLINALSANLTGNVTANWAISNYVSGNANPLFHIPGANVVGAVPTATNSTTANTALSVAGANVTGTVANATFAAGAAVANSANSVALANVTGAGNIASINLNGSGSDVLYGNGTWAPVAGGNSSNANYANFAGTAYSVSGSNVSGTVANANFATYADTADFANSIYVEAVNNNYSYHVVLTTGPGDTTLHNDVDDSFQYNPADGILTVTRVDATYFVGDLAFAHGLPAANVTGLGNMAAINLNGNGQTWLSGNGTFANIAIPAVGNIATLNLDGNSSNVLYGNGVFAAAPGGGGGNIGNLAVTGTTIGIAGGAPETAITIGANIASMTVDTDSGVPKINLQVGSTDSQFYESGFDFTSGTWVVNGLEGTLTITGYSPSFETFLNSLSQYQSFTITVNGSETTATNGYSWGGGNATFFTLLPPGVDPTNVTSIEFNTVFSNKLLMDPDEGDMGIYIGDFNFEIESQRDIRISAGDDFNIRANDGFEMRANSDFQITTNYNNAQQTWTFYNDGNLQLPSGSNVGNIATVNLDGNVSNVLAGDGTWIAAGGGGGGNTGNVTFDNVTVQGDNNGLNLSAGPDFTANLAYLQVRAGDVASHIHLDTGNNQAYDLILGDDQNYVQVSSTGNILLSAYDSNTNQYTWTLDYNGNLILAGGNSVIQSIANSSLDPLNPNVSTMVLTPDQGYSSQALVLDPTAPGHIHLRAPGANIDEPYANLFLGGETSSFEVGAFYGVAPNVFIHSGGNTWTFASDGNLIFPRDANINTDPYLRINGGATPTIISEDTSLAGPANLAIVSDYLTLQGYSEAITIRSNDGTISGSPNLSLSLNAYDDGDSPTVQLINWNSSSGFPTTIVSSETDQVALTTNVNSPNPYSWTFDNTGTLTVPGNLVAVNASPAPVISGFSSVSALQFTNGNSNVTINANSNIWTFDSTGNLIIPGTSGGVIKTVANGAIAIAAIDGGSDNPAQLVSFNANGTPTTAISAYANQATIQANINGDIKTWAFTNTGNMILPGNTFAVNYANGTQVSLGGGGVAEASFSIQSANFNAAAGSRYGVNTTTGAVTATLPASPATGVAIFFADAGGAYATNNLTIDAGAGTIMGGGNTLTVSTNNQSVGLFYNGSTWRIYNAG